MARVAGMDEAARAALTGFAATLLAHKTPVELSILRVETFLGVFIGAVTFTGSVIAYGKLAGKVDGKAKKLPGGHHAERGRGAVSLVLLVVYLQRARRWR
jgi:NAD(P) transhydrogenase subunit beta